MLPSIGPNVQQLTQERQCSECGQGFKRAEHLVRHQRAHTQDLPYACSHCHRRFSRQDVHHRHVNRFCRGGVGEGGALGAPRARPPPRTPRACLRCRSNKLKCDGTFPCGRCVHKTVTCSFDNTPSSRPQLQASAASSRGATRATYDDVTLHEDVDLRQGTAPEHPPGMSSD